MGEVADVLSENPEVVAAQVVKFLAEAEQAKAEAAKAQAEAENAKIELESNKIELERTQRAHKEALASNKYHHIYIFDDVVHEKSVTECMRALDVWRRTDPGCDIEIRFTSPGGEVLSGMSLFDYIMGLKADGHFVTTSCYGYAASMAGILLQAGNKRIMGRESYVLIHEISTAIRGKIGDIEDEVEFIKKIQDRVLTIFADRAAEADRNGTASKPLTKQQFKKNWNRRDWWLTSEEALEGGVVDEVR